MALRTSENVSRSELVKHDPANNIVVQANDQAKKKRLISLIFKTGNFYDWFNACFEMNFRLQKLDGTDFAVGDRITVLNGSHSFINHVVIKSGTKTVYNTDNLHLVTFVKNLLEYSEDYSRSVAKNSFWYLDDNVDIELQLLI